MNDSNEVQEPSVFDLLLFWEEAGGALGQGTVHPPKGGPAGHRAVRGNHEVASQRLGPRSMSSLVVLPVPSFTG